MASTLTDRRAAADDRPNGTVIVLNGTASSGKTNLAHALQEEMTEPYLEFGLDRHLGALPRHFFHRPMWEEVLGRWSEQGPVGELLVPAMHRSIAALARGGLNVVADHVLMVPEWPRDLADALDGLRAYLVAVRCDLETVVDRERARGDRTLGEARVQYPLVHRHGVYDLEVDTAVVSPDEGARAIAGHVRRAKPRAFVDPRAS